MSTEKGDTVDGKLKLKMIGFSLINSKKVKNRAVVAAFVDEEDQTFDNSINNDIPKKPLIIPCQKDSRQSLQGQAREKRQKEGAQPDVVQSDNSSERATACSKENEAGGEKIVVKQEECSSYSRRDGVTGGKSDTTDEDRAAIEALKQEAAAALGSDEDNGMCADNNDNNNKRIIASSGDTFQKQRDRDGKNEDQKKFEEDIECLPPDISVKSHVYQNVPISEFGAAMLRGMGWTGGNENINRKRNKATDATTMPRPARLGLGATPKVLTSGHAPDTHSRRRPRRQHQMQQDERLKRQQEQMELERHRQFSRDKQRILQVESIVYVDGDDDRRRRKQRSRGIVKQLMGVPGLNMILVQFEGDTSPTKVKKGSIELVDRIHLNEQPFEEARIKEPIRSMKVDRDERDYGRRDRDKRSASGSNSNDRNRERKNESKRRDRDDHHGNDIDWGRDRNRDRSRIDSDKDRDRDRDRDRKERDRDRDRDRNRQIRHRENDSERDRDGGREKRKHGDERFRWVDNKRHQSSRPVDSGKHSSTSLASWLIPNIRVRIVSSKYGRSMYKEKGVVVDVTRSGVATLTMGNGQVISVPERHLETALPKAGGNAIILSGHQRFSKGQLLERDGKKNCGVVQIFEDMSVVTSSLDDMAEWCGPLDDDLEN